MGGEGKVASILVVEDDKSFRHAVVRYLELDGHQVTEATDGADALAILSALGVDLVLTDIDMPKMNGIELIRCLRQKGLQVSVVVMSALEHPLQSVEHELGIVHVLRKPFDLEELATVLRQVLT